MKPNLTDKLTTVISANDFTDIQAIAVAERRKTSDVIRNLIEDVVEGRLDISGRTPPAKKHNTAVRIDAQLKEKIKEFQTRTGMSPDKVLHLALEKLRTGQDLLDGIDALAHKHRHSNSPRPPAIKDAA